MFSYNDHGKYLNPFLLLDRAGPLISQAQIQQTEALESTHTVGLKQSRLYDGEVAHHDSTGEGGVIGPGDVQWMTAASGILHQEYQSDAFMKKVAHLIWCNCGSICQQKTNQRPPATSC